MLARFKSLVLRYRLYRLMPPSLAARILATKPTVEDVEWARREVEGQNIKEDDLMAMRLNCYGGPLDGTSMAVKHPARGVMTTDEEGEHILYKREQYRLADSGRLVNVLVFGDSLEFFERVLIDIHDPSAYQPLESRRF